MRPSDWMGGELGAEGLGYRHRGRHLQRALTSLLLGTNRTGRGLWCLVWKFSFEPEACSALDGVVVWGIEPGT